MSPTEARCCHVECLITRVILAVPLLGWIQSAFLASASAQGQSTIDLAAKQNPIADSISVPLQNNTFFGVTEDDKVANVLDDRRSVPVGGAFGKIFRIGQQALNAEVQSFYSAESAEHDADWLLSF